MRAVTFRTFGGPEVVQVADVPEVHAGPDQVRIAVRAASINPIDYKMRRGPAAGGKPAEEVRVLGFDAAGVVDEVGDGVTGVAVGDEVFGLGQYAQAEYALLSTWVTKPEGMGWSEAGALGVIGETAARGLTLLGVNAGATVFVDGATGGVGKIAVQLAVRRGARVIGSGSAGKQDLIATLGAIPVRYGEGLGDRVRTAVAEFGVTTLDGVFDTAGKTPVEELIGLVATPRQVVTIANFGVGDSGVQVTSGGGSGTDPRASLEEVAQAYQEGKLRVEVNHVLPFAEAAAGHRAAEAASTKVVLVP